MIKEMQHFVPKYRYRFFNDVDKQHYQFSKDGKYIGKRGIGNSTSAEKFLYEATNGEYNINDLENYFSDNIEPKQKELIEKIINLINSRNVLNYERYKKHPLYYVDLNIDDILSFINTSILRLPEIIEYMNKKTLNKLNFFKTLNTFSGICYNHQINILYTSKNVHFILPDCGLIRGRTADKVGRTIIPLTPNICIEFIIYSETNILQTNTDIFINQASDEWVRWVNKESIRECYEKFVSRYEKYDV